MKYADIVVVKRWIPILEERGAETFYDSFVAENTPESMATWLAESFSPDHRKKHPPSFFFCHTRTSKIV